MPERLTLPNSEAANFIAHATASNDEQITSEPDDVSATREATLNNHERDQELAHLQKLLTSGVSGKKVVDSLSEFTHLSHQEIAIKLIEAGQGWSVVFNSDKFTGLNQEIAIKLVEAGWGWAGLGLYKGKEKYWFLILTIIAVLLALGNHFLPFTKFWYYYMPLYSKFRTVSIAAPPASATRRSSSS